MFDLNLFRDIRTFVYIQFYPIIAILTCHTFGNKIKIDKTFTVQYYEFFIRIIFRRYASLTIIFSISPFQLRYVKFKPL